jgi:tetratricopeptide (TPR) repeat protein
VKSPGLDAQNYRSALRRAEEACRLRPQDGLYLNTLGVAQYRSGMYQEARDTLNRSNATNSKRYPGGHPSDLAFLCMAHFQLGHGDQALKYLKQLHDPGRSSRAPLDEESAALLREAETLLHEPAAH